MCVKNDMMEEGGREGGGEKNRRRCHMSLNMRVKVLALVSLPEHKVQWEKQLVQVWEGRKDATCH